VVVCNGREGLRRLRHPHQLSLLCRGRDKFERHDALFSGGNHRSLGIWDLVRPNYLTYFRKKIKTANIYLAVGRKLLVTTRLAWFYLPAQLRAPLASGFEMSRW